MTDTKTYEVLLKKGRSEKSVIIKARNLSELEDKVKRQYDGYGIVEMHLFDTPIIEGKRFKDFDSFETARSVELFAEAMNKLNNLSDAERLFLKESVEKETNVEDVEEGLLGGIVGGIAGLAFGPKVGDAVCKALGITKGTLYDLLHSRIFTAAVCSYLGLKA